MQYYRYLFVLIAMMVGMNQTALAGDEELFAGLIPGVPVPDSELAEIFGKSGFVEITVDQGSILNLDDLSVNYAPTDDRTLSGNTTAFNNSGNTMITSVVGDGNTVNNFLVIEVNINTVELTDVSGSSINVNQSLDFDGLVTLFSN